MNLYYLLLTLDWFLSALETWLILLSVTERGRVSHYYLDSLLPSLNKLIRVLTIKAKIFIICSWNLNHSQRYSEWIFILKLDWLTPGKEFSLDSLLPSLNKLIRVLAKLSKQRSSLFVTLNESSSWNLIDSHQARNFLWTLSYQAWINWYVY